MDFTYVLPHPARWATISKLECAIGSSIFVVANNLIFTRWNSKIVTIIFSSAGSGVERLVGHFLRRRGRPQPEPQPGPLRSFVSVLHSLFDEFTMFELFLIVFESACEYT
jgi:hypothetical protein